MFTKKRALLGMLTFVLVFGFFSVSFASAQGPPAPGSGSGFAGSFTDFTNGFAEVVEPILAYTLGSGEGAIKGELLIVKLLFFFVMLAIISYAVRKVPGLDEGSTWLVWVVTFVVSVLAVRYLTSSALVEFLWLPYGAIGIALTSLLPFIIFFFFVQSFQNTLFKRVAWILFIVLFLGLTIIRWSELQQTVGSSGFNLAYIYLITIVLALISMIWDKNLRAAMRKSKLESIKDRGKVIHAGRLNREIQGLYAELSKVETPDERTALQSKIKDLERSLDALLKAG